MRNRHLLLGASLLCLATLALAQVGEIARQLGLGTKLSDTKISSGLKQALQIGAEQSVTLTARPDGYFGNPDIKILMPNNLRTLEKGLRMVGYGPKVDDFVLSMNRAAEAAAPAARQIFIDAITAMTIDDARGILSGGDTAATNYFKAKTTPQLTAAFGPAVERSMAKNGVIKQYNALTAQYKSIPFAKNQDLDISHYVVSKALDGLFYVGSGRAQDPQRPSGTDHEPAQGSIRSPIGVGRTLCCEDSNWRSPSGLRRTLCRPSPESSGSAGDVLLRVWAGSCR